MEKIVVSVAFSKGNEVKLLLFKQTSFEFTNVKLLSETFEISSFIWNDCHLKWPSPDLTPHGMAHDPQ